MCNNPAKYFKAYRQRLGFSSQDAAKKFLGGKDLVPGIDYEYIGQLNLRIEDIVYKLQQIASSDWRQANVEEFIERAIRAPYAVIRSAKLIPRLNNQGRRPEQVLFSWLRGHAVMEYFRPAMARIFGVTEQDIATIGEDDLQHVETFRRSPTADLEIKQGDNRLRVEMQAGFQGINDIKEHKVREARAIFQDQGVHTLCVHFDLFNGQVAFVQLSKIAENDPNFVTRQQMEGQSVLSIDQNYFKWRLMDEHLPKFDDLELDLPWNS